MKGDVWVLSICVDKELYCCCDNNKQPHYVITSECRVLRTGRWSFTRSLLLSSPHASVSILFREFRGRAGFCFLFWPVSLCWGNLQSYQCKLNLSFGVKIQLATKRTIKWKFWTFSFSFSLFNLATDFYLTPKERRMFLNWIGSQAWLDEHKQIHRQWPPHWTELVCRE